MTILIIDLIGKTVGSEARRPLACTLDGRRAAVYRNPEKDQVGDLRYPPAPARLGYSPHRGGDPDHVGDLSHTSFLSPGNWGRKMSTPAEALRTVRT